MTPTKLLIGQILAVFAFLTLGVWAATQWAAAMLAYLERIMAGLKLSKPPDRTPVKITVHLPPELNQALGAYAEAYREIYGEAEPIAELIMHYATAK